MTDTEKKLFRLLHDLGVMFGGQIQAHKVLHHAPRTARTILARLRKENKIMEHTMKVGGKDYRIYTLGPAGTSALGVPYEPDNWLRYTNSEAIQRLMAVDLYIRMCDYLSADMTVKKAENPYIHTFLHGDRAYQVGVIWDTSIRFLETYRWAPPKERVILICQSVRQADNLLSCLNEDLPIRVITRDKLREGLVFYRMEKGRWVLDIPDRQIVVKQKTRIIAKHKMLLS